MSQWALRNCRHADRLWRGVGAAAVHPCQPGHGVRRPRPPGRGRVLDLVEADTANQFVRHLAEATLTLVLFCDAVRVNLGRLRHESALPTRLLGIGLPLTIVAGTLAGLAFFPQLDLWTAAALATMLAPPTPRSG
jgi:hypothetical protein